MAAYVVARFVVTSKLGKVLVAIRDAESRTRFLGYRVDAYKTFLFTLSACMAGVAGALYVPQVGIINPSEFHPANSIEVVIWVAVGGRGTLVGAALGAIVVNFAKTTFTSGILAPYWLFVLGAMFVLVTIFLPKGIIGTWQDWREKREAAAAGTPPSGRIGEATNMTDVTHSLLYLSGVEVSFDGFRALNGLSLDIRHGEMRAIIGPNGARQDDHDGRHHRQDPARRRRGDVRPHGGPHQARRGGDRQPRHRPKIPETHCIRDAHGRG